MFLYLQTLKFLVQLCWARKIFNNHGSRSDKLTTCEETQIKKKHHKQWCPATPSQFPFFYPLMIVFIILSIHLAPGQGKIVSSE